MALKIVALAGGVGGARLVDGLAACLPPENLTVIVNTGDDFEHLGLAISPDLDTVMYTLAGLANPDAGWGRADETWNFLESLGRLGGETWFRLGDRDLAVHVERTRRKRAGEMLSEITGAFCRSLGVRVRLLPMTDQPVCTIVVTTEGDLPFQEYFVARGCRPVVRGFRFEAIERARPAPGVLEALRAADAVVLCPSNPFVSLDPILAVPGMRAAVQSRPVVAVSPIVGGRALKGPAAKMFGELGARPGPAAVAAHFAEILRAIVIDRQDQDQAAELSSDSLAVLMSDTVMRSRADRRRLAGEVLGLAELILQSEGTA